MKHRMKKMGLKRPASPCFLILDLLNENNDINPDGSELW
jgi:hypothetical protein